jgi:hypothetical protein
MSITTKADVVAAAAVKNFLQMVESYDGSDRNLRTYLLRRLRQMNARADANLAYLLEEIL